MIALERAPNAWLHGFFTIYPFAAPDRFTPPALEHVDDDGRPRAVRYAGRFCPAGAWYRCAEPGPVGAVL